MKVVTGDHIMESLPPLGCVEPNAALLKQPPDDQALYKVMSLENLLRCMSGRYMHFNRADQYKDFPGADAHDSEQLPTDRPAHSNIKFEKAPSFTAADYYDLSRSRTYACCLSTVNSEFIWINYGDGGAKGKVCLVFNFGKLRAEFNRVFAPGSAALEYNGLRCHQIFSINYGLVEYIDWDTHQGNLERLPNPIQYTYWKDRNSFQNEHELRISLSAIGMGHFVPDDGSTMEFRDHLQVSFDFRSAVANGAIQQILHSADCDVALLRAELLRHGIDSR
jgi:hypothetical protein